MTTETGQLNEPSNVDGDDDGDGTRRAPRPVLVLVGPPGVGKSTVGALLAERLGVACRDTDADIEAETGAPIADIFVQHGEPHFRALEKSAVRRALAEHDGVLVLGGGAIMDPDTRALLAGHRVAFLDVSLHEAANRIGLNVSRPLLLGNVRAEWTRLMNDRRPLYTEVATLTVSTDGRAPDEIVDVIQRQLRP
jgi:shikimate kinase